MKSRTTRPTTVPFSRPSYVLRGDDVSDVRTREERGEKDALFERGERLGLEVALDLAARRDVECLARVLAVTNIQAKNADALDDGEEDVRAELRARGEADDHERAAVAEVVDGLRVRDARRGGDDRRVRAEPVRRGDDVLHEVLRLAEVDPLLRAELRHELLLLGAGVCSQCAYSRVRRRARITCVRLTYRWRRRGGPWRRRTARPSGRDLHPHQGGRSSRRSSSSST